MPVASRRRFFSWVGALLGGLSSVVVLQRSRSEAMRVNAFSIGGLKWKPENEIVLWPGDRIGVNILDTSHKIADDTERSLISNLEQYRADQEVLTRVQQRMEDAQSHLIRRHIELKYGEISGPFSSGQEMGAHIEARIARGEAC